MRTVRRVIGVLVLAIVGVWPAVHCVFMERSGGDPWKLFGWAMYADASPRHEFSLIGVRAGAEHLIPTPATVVGTRFVRRSNAFGSAASPAELFDLVERTHPDLDAVIVRIETERLDRECRCLRSSIVEYRRDL